MRIEQKFTGTEVLILKFSANGMNSKQIGKKLELSPRTIDNKKAKILEKTESRTMIEAVVKAIKQNLISA